MPEAPIVGDVTAQLMLSGVRAFVVDDNDTNRLILREMLSNRGAVVDEAEDGPAALEQFEHARTRGIPHTLMILDCRMPGMDSFQVAERLKAREAQGLTVLMLSSDDLKVEIARAHELVLDAYLIKPVRRSELFEAIRTAMTNQAPAPDAGIKKPEQTSALPSINGPIPETQATLHILLADDSPDNRVLIHAYLKDTGYLLDDGAPRASCDGPRGPRTRHAGTDCPGYSLYHPLPGLPQRRGNPASIRCRPEVAAEILGAHLA